jgi:DNA polymerase-3 subunit delta'
MSLLESTGQDRAINLLQLARNSQRVPHSYIFYGPEGVGKGWIARQWSALRFCSNIKRIDWPADRDIPANVGHLEDSCGQCSDCHLVQSGNHPDLHVITKDLVKHASQGRDRQPIELPIDIIREFIIDQAGLFPSRGRARIFIIEEADTMTREAQNSLLKTLEEPPANTFLILLTSKADRLLPTIRSRCQLIRFGALPTQFIVQRLEEAGIPPQQATYWGDFSEGRLGVALELAEMELYEKKCVLISQLARLSYDSVLEIASWLTEQAKDYAQIYLKKKPGPSQSAAVRRGYLFFLQMLSHAFHLAIRSLADAGQMDSPGLDQGEEISRIAETFDLTGCSQAIRATYRAGGLLHQNVNVSLIFESLMLQYLDYSKKGVKLHT